MAGATATQHRRLRVRTSDGGGGTGYGRIGVTDQRRQHRPRPPAARNPHQRRRLRNWPRRIGGSRINGGQRKPRPGRQRRRSQPRNSGGNTNGSGSRTRAGNGCGDRPSVAARPWLGRRGPSTGNGGSNTGGSGPAPATAAVEPATAPSGVTDQRRATPATARRQRQRCGSQHRQRGENTGASWTRTGGGGGGTDTAASGVTDQRVEHRQRPSSKGNGDAAPRKAGQNTSASGPAPAAAEPHTAASGVTDQRVERRPRSPRRPRLGAAPPGNAAATPAALELPTGYGRTDQWAGHRPRSGQQRQRRWTWDLV